MRSLDRVVKELRPLFARLEAAESSVAALEAAQEIDHAALERAWDERADARAEIEHALERMRIWI